MTSPARTQGAHHIGLTVPDLPEASGFFINALGFEKVGDVPDYPAEFVSDGSTMITLWQAEDPLSATPFDRRRNLGLHHLALRVSAPDALDELARELRERRDCSVEFEPERLGKSDIKHMMIRIPGNIRVELIAV